LGEVCLLGDFFSGAFAGEDFRADVEFFDGDVLFTTFAGLVVLDGDDLVADALNMAAASASIFFAVCVAFLGDLRSWNTGSRAAFAFATTLPFFGGCSFVLAIVRDVFLERGYSTTLRQSGRRIF
jgi:hypothetical protein